MAYGIVVALAALAGSGGADWRMAGTTYNSVAFVDLNSVQGSSASRRFTAMRVSGQPAKDGWRNVVQKLAVNCDTRMFVDAGSRIEQSDGSVKAYPGFGASQRAMVSGVFFDMYRIVCERSEGRRVSDPEAWTRANFKVGS